MCVPETTTTKPADTAKEAGHDLRYAASGSQAGEAEALTISQQLKDPATAVFVVTHLAALAAPFIYGITWRDVMLVFVTYNLRMFGITAGFHRLLSHRSYQTSRAVQFLFAWLGTASLQKGPLWWSSHHRHHHRTADTKEDAHSPVQHGFFWSHIGWFLCTNRHVHVLWGAIPDLSSVPELMWLEKYYQVPPLALLVGLYVCSGMRAALYGFAVSTVLCWHCTYAINSIAHMFGEHKFDCEFNGACTARNNMLLAILTLGEGWHNTHHHEMGSVRHGLKPWEVDVTYYVIRLLERVGLVWNLRMPSMGLLVAHED